MFFFSWNCDGTFFHLKRSKSHLHLPQNSRDAKNVTSKFSNFLRLIFIDHLSCTTGLCYGLCCGYIISCGAEKAYTFLFQRFAFLADLVLNFAVIDPFILVFVSTDGSMIVCSSMDVRAQKTAVSCNVSGVDPGPTCVNIVDVVLFNEWLPDLFLTKKEIVNIIPKFLIISCIRCCWRLGDSFSRVFALLFCPRLPLPGNDIPLMTDE